MRVRTRLALSFGILITFFTIDGVMDFGPRAIHISIVMLHLQWYVSTFLWAVAAVTPHRLATTPPQSPHYVHAPLWSTIAASIARA